MKRKLRLLALGELCSGRVGDNVSYKEMSATLNLGGKGQTVEDEGEEVEIWVIDGSFFPLSLFRRLFWRLFRRLFRRCSRVTISRPESITKRHWKRRRKT